jgi:hypothetical protein
MCGMAERCLAKFDLRHLVKYRELRTGLLREDGMPKLEVFVSHRTVEARFADALRTHLSRDFIGILNFFVSTDVTSVPAGSQWFDTVVAGLQRAHLLLAICSNESVRLPWINYETGGACARNVDVIPLCHSGMLPEHLPVPLSMLEALQLSHPRDLEKLYVKISSLIGSDVPNVNFQTLSEEFKTLEAEYSAQIGKESSAIEQRNGDSVHDPRVLCVSSEQYLELGFANQLQTVLDAFPKDLRHDVVTSSAQLVSILSSQQVDVVHIAAYVCPRSGSLYFSRVELPLGRPVDNEDYIQADALAMLLERARTRLVVIASGDSLALATGLLRLTNVISPRDIISARAMAVWVRTFYTGLRTQTIAEACELATAQSRAPMKLLTQQVASAMKLTWDMKDTSTTP